ncbi:ABC transporter substrate-binding protein [Aestuariivirga sp.]|jgi:polar amino acid transport system substrate-binding protein|uniref:ABC transporter substrate-binding protein n=1 Tax=Aestuariivirga sp. TaxID=2650926 RepID=UPI00378356DC
MRFGKILAAMAVAAAFSAGAVQSASAGPACEPDKLAEKYPSLAGKTIKIGGDPQTPPFVMRDAADFNNIVGFDADFAKAVMDCHGIKYEWFLAGWSGILPAVVAGQADVFWDNLYYTPERAKEVDYVLYMQAATGALTQANNTKDIKGFDDFCGNRVAVGVGTVEEPQVRKQDEKCKAEGKPGIEILTYPDVAAAIRLVSDERTDIVLYDLTVVDEQVKKDPAKFKRAFMMLSGFNIGTAVKNDNKDLNQAIFDGIQIMQENGKQAELMSKYGVDPAMIVKAEIKTE